MSLQIIRHRRTGNRALDNASSAQEYISLGGSPRDFKEEIKQGSITLADQNTLAKTHAMLSQGSYLFFDEEELLHNPDIIHDVNHRLHCAEAANTLWDTPLGSLYDAIQSRTDPLISDTIGAD